MRLSIQHPRRRAIAARLRDEAGFTLVEILVAIVILGIGSLAVLQVFDTSTRNAFRAEQSQVAINVAQRELEAIRNLDYGDIALTSTPTFVSDAGDPRNRVSGTRFDVDGDGGLSEMVFNGGPLEGGGTVSCSTSPPCVASGPEDFQSGDVTGKIFRFVVWRNDPSCSQSACPGGQDLKRVIIAVKLDTVAVSYDRPYVEVQSDFVDPEAASGANPPTGNEVNVPQQLWLTDTTCDFTTRQPIANNDPLPEGHSLHNTLGPCGAGLKTGSDQGAPDLLDADTLPPDPTPNDPADPPIYDYATDVERPPEQPDDDGGIQVSRRGVPGCEYTAGTPQQTHRWVTNPIDALALPDGFVLAGSGTLRLYARTLGGAEHPAGLCVFLFHRTAETPTTWTDTVLDTEEHLIPSVSSDEWGEVTVPLTFPTTTIQPNTRLGLAIALEQGGTPAETVQILYDHPDAKSRLEVVTPTPISE